MITYTANGSEDVRQTLLSCDVCEPMFVWLRNWPGTIWCPCSVFTKQYTLVPSSEWAGGGTLSINAMQSHSGEHFVAKRLYAILKYVKKKKPTPDSMPTPTMTFYCFISYERPEKTFKIIINIPTAVVRGYTSLVYY